MPIDGPTVHQLLMEAHNHHHAAYESDRAAAEDTKARRESLDAGRTDTLEDLAEFYLPELSPEAISATWAEVRGRITSVLGRQRDEVARLSRQLDRHDETRRRLDDELVEINASLDESMDRQRELAERLEKELQSNLEFQELATRAAQAEAALERAEANLAEIEQDAARKLPAYDDNALFQYLFKRRFGTPEYTHRGFTRRMDRGLAKFIGFNGAVKSYEFLRQTPTRMRKVIAEDHAALDTVMTELEHRRDLTSQSLGLDLVNQRVDQLMRRRTEIVHQLDSSLREIDTTRREMTAAGDTRGPHYREAIKIFREMLEGFETEDLKRRARRTIDVTDDQIVARFEGVEDRIESLEDRTQKKHTQMVRRHQMLTQLGQIIQRFRTAGFDSRRSQFVDQFDITAATAAAMQSVDDYHWDKSIENLWNQIRSAQRWGPSVTEQIGNVAAHPMTQVLVNAAAHVAGGMLAGRMRNAGRRRYGHRRRGHNDWGSWGNRW